jgi:hypothetical protein
MATVEKIAQPMGTQGHPIFLGRLNADLGGRASVFALD